MISGSLLELYKIFRSKRPPVAFIGSGLSQNHLSWVDFVRQLAIKAENHRALEWINNCCKIDNIVLVEDLLAIARECIVKINSQTELSVFIENKFNKFDNTPEVFESIVRAPFMFYITTNYDNNIENAYQQTYGKSLESFTFNDVEFVLNRIARNKQFILKLHGSAANPNGGFIISDSDYKNIISSNPSVRLMMSTIFSSFPVVFMGYGHRDPHIIYHLRDNRAVLKNGGQRHFTFMKNIDNVPYSLHKLYKELYGISTVKIDKWEVINTILLQVSYMRISDRSVETRLDNFSNFIKFTNDKDASLCWGALMYASSSSEIGRSDVAFKLLQSVNKYTHLKEKIEGDPALHIIYLIVIGQYYKRRGNITESIDIFDKIEYLCKNEENIIPSLKSKGLRYAGIFWLNSDPDRSFALFDSASVFASNGDPEEKINLTKWQLVSSGGVDSVTKLIKLADESRNNKYIKSAAWCRFGAINIAFDIQDGVLLPEQVKELRKSLIEFESIDHLQGIAEASILICRHYLKSGHIDSEFEKLIDLASGISRMCGLKSTHDRANELRKYIVSPV